MIEEAKKEESIVDLFSKHMATRRAQYAGELGEEVKVDTMGVPGEPDEVGIMTDIEKATETPKEEEPVTDELEEDIVEAIKKIAKDHELEATDVIDMLSDLFFDEEAVAELKTRVGEAEEKEEESKEEPEEEKK